MFKNKGNDGDECSPQKSPPPPPTKKGVWSKTPSDNQKEMITSEKCQNQQKLKEKRQPSTVLFVEYSKGGSLQKAVRQVVDKVSDLVGFTMRVTERGGTPLGSLLSNKNLGGGCRCGRLDCKPCMQVGERVENCKTRNILYESECVSCNPEEGAGGSKTLEDTRSIPSIYVGESARSLYERSCEHWADAEAKKESSHMVEHVNLAHKGEEGGPNFNFKVIKSFKTCLERQIAEAVRIQKRGGVLNRRGEYNRCGITRLVLDNEWEKKKWDQAWEDNEGTGTHQDEEIADFGGHDKNKVGGGSCKSPTNFKKRKIENEQGDIWGEEVGVEILAKQEFLRSGVSEPKNIAKKNLKQLRLVTLSGTEWFIHQLLKEISGSSVEIGEDIILGQNMPEWDKASEDDELLNWKALLEVDEQDKIASKKREKNTKFKNKNLSVACIVKNKGEKKEREEYK